MDISLYLFLFFILPFLGFTACLFWDMKKGKFCSKDELVVESPSGKGSYIMPSISTHEYVVQDGKAVARKPETRTSNLTVIQPPVGCVEIRQYYPFEKLTVIDLEKHVKERTVTLP